MSPTLQCRRSLRGTCKINRALWLKGKRKNNCSLPTIRIIFGNLLRHAWFARRASYLSQQIANIDITKKKAAASGSVDRLVHTVLFVFSHGPQVSNSRDSSSCSVHGGDSAHEARRVKRSIAKDRDRISLSGQKKQGRRKRRRASRSASPSRGGTTLARFRRSGGVGDGATVAAARKKPTGGRQSLQLGLSPSDMQVGRWGGIRCLACMNSTLG